MASMSYLERALHSLHSQVDVSVKPILVTQRFSESEVNQLREAMERNWYFSEHQSLEIINFQDDSDKDVRSHLLNLGIKSHIESGNTFLGFLDYDDFLYSHAYSVLTSALLEKNAAFAFASVEMANVVPLKDYDFIYELTRPFTGSNKIDLLRDNFCPLHSYLINTDVLEDDQLYFREDMNRVEDYEFLIRLAGANPCDFSNLGTFIGCYVMRSDGTNTTIMSPETKEEKIKAEAWADNVKLLNKYKSCTEVKFFASDF